MYSGWQRHQEQNYLRLDLIQNTTTGKQRQSNTDTRTHGLVSWADGGGVMEHQNLCFKLPRRLWIQAG